MTLRILCGVAAALFSLVVGCHHVPHGMPSSPTTSDSADSFIRLDEGIDRPTRLVTDNIRINGTSAHLIVDTGSGLPITLFSPSLAKFGMKIVERGSPATDTKPGRVVPDVSQPCKIEVFGKTFHSVKLPVLPIPPWAGGEEEDGIVGWSAIRSNVWWLSLAERAIAPLETVPSDALTWTKFSIVEDDNQLSLRFADAAAPVPRIIIDTGNASGLMLPPPKWREWSTTHSTAPRTLDTDWMFGSPTSLKEESWADEIHVGNLVLHDIPVMEAEPAYVRTAAPREDIVVMGLGALKRIDLVLDGEHGVAYARASGAPAPPYKHNRIGADFIPADENSSELIAHVLAGSPAAEAGIREGDQLLQVDGQDMADWRTHPKRLDAIKSYYPPGTEFSVTLKRGDQIIRTTITTRDILTPKSRSGPHLLQ